MDHQDVIEQLEVAAVEPGGLDRLMAGDTTTAAAVVGHLAGCDACSSEFQRLARAVPLLRDLVRTSPPADLRERTLAFVRAHGQPRGAEAVDVPTETMSRSRVVEEPRRVPAGADDRQPGAGDRQPGVARGPWTSRVLPWAAALAAVVALAVATVTFVGQRDLSDRIAAQTQAIAGLEAVNASTIDITGGPDAERVTLVSTGGGATTGTLLFSPSTTRLVVVATDLMRPPSGQEYRCWVEIGGRRENVGRMFFAGDLAFWVGDTPEISDLAPRTTFGVSLTEIGSSSLEADPVIVGRL